MHTTVPRQRRPQVYLIGRSTDRLVKIGSSIDPRERLVSLRTAAAADLSLLWHGPGGQPIERALHDHFRAHRVTGEWFDFGDLDPVALVPEAAARFALGFAPVEADALCVRPDFLKLYAAVAQGHEDRHAGTELAELLARTVPVPARHRVVLLYFLRAHPRRGTAALLAPLVAHDLGVTVEDLKDLCAALTRNGWLGPGNKPTLPTPAAPAGIT